jgi:hypothetical protein
MRKLNYILIHLLLTCTIFCYGCGNSNNENRSTDHDPDNMDSSANTKVFTIKERQVFFASAQKKLDSLAHKIDAVDKEVRKKKKLPANNWPASRDSIRLIIDKANRRLNSQNFKSDADWANLKTDISNYIDSATVKWNRYPQYR